MKKMIMLLVLLTVTLSSTGCTNPKSQTVDAEGLREAAWMSLSDSAKEEVVIDWTTAIVEKVKLSELPIVQSGGEAPQVESLYKITFNSDRDLLLGPIQVFINGDNKEIVSYGVRR